MKRVCAWCGQDLEKQPFQGTASITHGVCPSCRHEHFAAKPREKADEDAPRSAEQNELVEEAKAP